MDGAISPATSGALIVPGGVRFAVWAPKARVVEVVVEGPDHDRIIRLKRDSAGYHSVYAPGVGAGARYRFRLDGGDRFPDPCSRFQPLGVHGPSEVIDAADFAWSDGDWPGLSMDGQVIYELHVGTATPAGTFTALIEQLPALRNLGVTAIELMPVAAFPGRWNWGYDGVALYAPSENYGRPDDLRRFVDAAHGLGLGVIQDVVYNHLGPDGNYLGVYSDDYFTDRHVTPWGAAVNFDGPNSRPVRDFVINNARMWIRDYHMDGLRLDATHALVDDGPEHILAELARRTRAATDRGIILIAEDERNDVQLIQPADQGGYGLDAVWADDFHHALRVRLTGERYAYFADFTGNAGEIAAVVNDGFLYQGQPTHEGAPRGTQVTDEPASAFIFCTQNHDQTGNRAFGERLNHLVDPESAAVAAAILLLAPETPMLWMGEEFAASSLFLYFTDHNQELGRLVTEGRRREFAGFHPETGEIPDPQAERTFSRSKLDLDERVTNAAVVRLYRDLIALRHGDPVLWRQRRDETHAWDSGEQVVVVHRWHAGAHRLLIANFGPAIALDGIDWGSAPNPDLKSWKLLLSTADRRYRPGESETAEHDVDKRIGDVLPPKTALIFATNVGEFAST